VGHLGWSARPTGVIVWSGWVDAVAHRLMPADVTSSTAARRQRLVQRRKALGLTQEALAELVAVGRSSVVRWERGESEPLPSIRPRLVSH
jgi:DNA-binding transcriptional regulator YiaG